MKQDKFLVYENEADLINKVAKKVDILGGKVVYVGGYVRDKILRKINKDIDVEIYGVTKKLLMEILSLYGVVEEVGSQFGVLKIHGVDVDFALPRREYVGHVIVSEAKIIIPEQYSNYIIDEIIGAYPGFEVEVNNTFGYKHTDFIVISDPFMTMKEASLRRDFTINSIMEDVLTGELYDFHGGIDDLKAGIIKHIDCNTFIQDALRVLRACQFSARFEFQVHPTTIQLCREIPLSKLPKERIFEELKKALLKADKPSIAFECMREMKVIDELFPELLSIINCTQPEEYHPEGDVWVHTMLVLDELAKLRDKSSNPIALMLSGLCHDLGKPITKSFENGKITFLEHAEAGVHIVERFLRGITNDKEVKSYVKNMVENHMRPNSIAFVSSDKAVRKLMVEANIEELLLLSEADHKGRGVSEKEKDYSEIRAWFDEKIKNLSNANKGKIEPIVTGKDLIAKGIEPGKRMGEILRQAFELQIEGKSKEEIMDIVLA